MSPDKISALLGRPLSAVETTNFKTYLALAQSDVSDILCSEICAEHDTKTFQPRVGYRTLNLPIFSAITSVTVNGTVTTDYKTLQGSRLNGSWFNNIVFTLPPFGTWPYRESTVEIEADWGFYNMPIDIQKMVAQRFGMVTATLEDDQLKSKQIDDFRIIFNDTTLLDTFAAKYAPTITKYSGCTKSDLQSGDIYYHRGGYARGSYGRFYDF